LTLIDLPTRAPAGTVRARPALPRSVERFAGVAVLLIVWQVLSSAGLLGADVLAGPVETLQTGWHLILDGTLESAVWASLQRVLIGLAIGVPAGTILALTAGLTRTGDDLVDAPMQALRFVPVIGLEPLVIMWFGIGNAAKISIIVFGVLFPVYINTHAAVRNLDPRHRELARTVGLGRFAVIRRIVLPGALPGFLVGLRMAVAVSWLILVFSEQINSTNGIGYLIVQAETFFQTDTIVVALATYAVLGLICDALVRALERKVLAWLPGR
jgi:sulfonate transport system permease protein